MRSLVAAVLVGLVAIAAPSGRVVADEAGTDPPEPGGPVLPSDPRDTDQVQPTFDFDAGPDDIGVGGSTPSGFVPGSTTTPGSGRPRCTYRRATVGEFGDTPGGQRVGNPGASSNAQVEESASAGESPRLGWWKSCPPRGAVFVWLEPTVDIGSLIDGAEAQVRQRVPLPGLDINPAPEDGSYVNLGLWLALRDPGVVTVRVDVGGAWAQVSARHRGFEVDFGNGDTQVCDGFGVSIHDVVPDLDTFDEGPCGYTYRLSSPEDDPYQMTVRARWAITYTTSVGTAGSLGTMQRTLTVDYDIDEIQTVGVRN